MNGRRVLRVVGFLLSLTSLTMVVPLGLAFAFGEPRAAVAFAEAIACGLVAGLAAIAAGQPAKDEFYRREGLAVVAVAWIVCAAVGCLPYIFSGVIPGVIDAYFETMSGFTTTGASVMRVVEVGPDGVDVPKSILFWRCLTNWLGGVGIVVLFVALLPALGVGSRIIFHMEVPGVGEKGFMPQIRQTAAILWLTYLALTLAEWLALLACGLDWFNALCHSLSTLATGGFSTHTASVGHYSAASVRIVVTLFMFLAGVNFTLYFRLWHGRPRDFLRDPEFRLYAGITAGAILLIAFDLHRADLHESAGGSLLASAFQVVSVATTTGFATEDFDRWPDFSRMLLVVLMFIGGSAGSTAGGMKVIRVALAVKFLLRQLRLHVKPRSVEGFRIGQRNITPETLVPVIGMVGLFVATFVLGALVLAATGLDLVTAATASIATLGNIGPGLAGVGPAANFADLGATAKVTCTLLMLVGRLEIYTALSLFVPTLWRN